MVTTSYEVNGAQGVQYYSIVHQANGQSPQIISVVPDTGPVTGGTPVTITGAHFSDGATVTFGGIQASDVTVFFQAEITCTTPAHPAGTVDVSITNSDQRAATLQGGFEYVIVGCDVDGDNDFDYDDLAAIVDHHNQTHGTELVVGTQMPTAPWG